jgi:hypothetical protein
MASPFKDLQDAVHDIKRTVLEDGEQFIASNHTIWVTQYQWDDIITDPYVNTLPQAAIDDLVVKKILGVNIALRA